MGILAKPAPIFLEPTLRNHSCAGQDAEVWVGELGREFRRYFQAWFGARKKPGQRIPEV